MSFARFSPGLWGGRAFALALIAFLLSPMVILVILSFSNDNYVIFPPDTYGLRWYEAMIRDPNLLRAFGTSAVVGLCAATLGLLIGLPTAVLLVRHEFRGAGILRVLTLSPLVLPEILLGIALLQIGQWYLRGGASMWFLIVGHTIVVLPFCIQLISSSLTRLNREIEEAALTLGATPLVTFRRVVLPCIAGGTVSAGLLSFIISFDNVSISLFLTGPGVTTLPIRMYEYATYSSDPSLAAISAVLVYLGVAFTFLLGRLRGFQAAATTTR